MAPTTLILALAALLLSAPAQAGEGVNHSGRIVAEDLARHTLTLEEMGPWRGPGGGLEREVVTLTSDTRIELAVRSPHAPSGWPSGFAEHALTPEDLKTGDFVTVTAAREDNRLVAAAITVVRPSGSSP